MARDLYELSENMVCQLKKVRYFPPSTGPVDDGTEAMIDDHQAGGATLSGVGDLLAGHGAPRPAVDSANPHLTNGPAMDTTHRSNISSNDAMRNELVLIQRILAGESELFMELVRPYERLVYSMAVSIVKCEHDAEDVSQESLFKAFKKLSQFRGECKFSTWVIQITLNEARHRIRKKQRAAEDSLECGYKSEEGDYVPIDLADWREIPSEALQRKELRDALYRAISDLKPIYREVLVLRDVEHLSVEETAQLLNISECAVKTRLLRARLQVRDALAPGFDGYWNTGSTMYKRVRPF